MTSEGPILPQVAQGGKGAMDLCIERYGGLVWSIAQKYARHANDAEDLVQEIFTALWRSASRFNPAMASEATFIGVLARRRSIDWLRKQGRRPDLEPLSPELDEMTEAPATHPSATADRALVMTALEQLPEETRRLFLFHFESGMSHSEIANETGLPLGTVKTRLRSGLVEIRKHMKRLDSPQQPRTSA